MADFIDWPRQITIADVKVRPVSSYRDGALTRDDIQYNFPEPGGRFAIDIVPVRLRDDDRRLYGWLLSEMEAGALIRVRVPSHPERVAISGPGECNKLPYVSGGIESYHSDGSGFAWVPTARAVGDVLQGTLALTVDLGSYGPVLKPGHVFGYGDNINVVRQVSYAGSIATITTRLPLQRDIADNSIIRLWPRLVGRPTRESIKGFRATYEMRRFISPGPVTLMEHRF